MTVRITDSELATVAAPMGTACRDLAAFRFGLPEHMLENIVLRNALELASKPTRDESCPFCVWIGDGGPGEPPEACEHHERFVESFEIAGAVLDPRLTPAERDMVARNESVAGAPGFRPSRRAAGFRRSWACRRATYYATCGRRSRTASSRWRTPGP